MSTTLTPTTAGIVDHPTDYATASLKYSGTIAGYMNINVGILVELDTSIGIRYEVTFTGCVKSHTAFFYKFSKPYQTIYYNFMNHKATVIKSSASGNEPDVSVTGKETINNYPCTHLQHLSANESQDYWMSKAVPGFAQVARVLSNIDPSLKVIAINQSIFNWGGLVKLKMKSVGPNTGDNTTFTLNLFSAQAGIPIALSDFDIPSK